jgi:hypothetical protein
VTIKRKSPPLDPEHLKQTAAYGDWPEVLRIALQLQRMVLTKDNQWRRIRRELKTMRLIVGYFKRTVPAKQWPLDLMGTLTIIQRGPDAPD